MAGAISCLLVVAQATSWAALVTVTLKSLVMLPSWIVIVGAGLGPSTCRGLLSNPTAPHWADTTRHAPDLEDKSCCMEADVSHKASMSAHLMDGSASRPRKLGKNP
mmetsp:Transcript_34985/g.78700  ORF Transcript_34985/g.78700 Transcript_34985/m.78700 type:complete len:106 (+) Transcript_34985:1148-1465(+)